MCMLGGSTTPANPAYTPKELAYQLEMTKAKVLIAHPSNVELALAAADLVGLAKDRIFLFGDKSVSGVLPYSQVFLNQRRATPVEFTAQQAEDSVAYLCFSSGTTGRKQASILSTFQPTNILTCLCRQKQGRHDNVSIMSTMPTDTGKLTVYAGTPTSHPTYCNTTPSTTPLSVPTRMLLLVCCPFSTSLALRCCFMRFCIWEFLFM